MKSTNTSKTGVKIGNQVLALKLCCFHKQLASLPGATYHPLIYQKSRQNCMLCLLILCNLACMMSKDDDLLTSEPVA